MTSDVGSRFRLILQYDGSGYVGWQLQPRGRTVQGEMEAALLRLTGARRPVQGAGRTDTGVHALGQVAHFDSDASRSERSWILGLNSNLPAGISVSIFAVNSLPKWFW